MYQGQSTKETMCGDWEMEKMGAWMGGGGRGGNEMRQVGDEMGKRLSKAAQLHKDKDSNAPEADCNWQLG